MDSLAFISRFSDLPLVKGQPRSRFTYNPEQRFAPARQTFGKGQPECLPAVQSQIQNYPAKAKEFARLAVVAKSLRHSRQYRKLAQMYWALALCEEPERSQASKTSVKRNTT
jgi:hypothetical protein